MQAGYQLNPWQEVINALARLRDRFERLQSDAEDLKLRETTDQQLRDGIAALLARVVELESAEVAWDDITGKPSTFAPAVHDNDEHSPDFLTTVAWGDITGKPSTFTPSVHANEAHDPDYITGIAWGDITSKPSTFTPSVHANEAHSPSYLSAVTWGDIGSKPSTFTPSVHGDEAHSPDFSVSSHTHSHASGTHTHNLENIAKGAATKPTSTPIG